MSTGVNEPAAETPSAPAPGTPEYDAAMADKYVEANSPASEETPAAKPEENPEDKPAAPSLKIEPEESTEEESTEETNDESSETDKEEEKQEETPAAPIPAELFDKATEEFQSSGELTEETIEGFISKGIPREFLDNYVAGLKALQTQMVTEAQSLVGGSDNWDAMMSWAKGLPEADIEAFNEAVTNPKTSSLAIQGLYSRFTAENGSEAPSAAGSAERGATGGDVYRSTSEMTADIRDPRYKSDVAFRTGVEQKIVRSRKAGTLGTLGTAY